MTLLELDNVSRQFGGLLAVADVTAHIQKGEIVGLIGPNGAGKTTLFNLISGFDRPTEGRVSYQGKDITSWPAYKRARTGIGRTFQNLRLFNKLSVLDHVILGQHILTEVGVLQAALRLPRYKRQEERLITRGLQLLELTGLEGRSSHLAHSLPYGLQRRLEIARALAFSPALLLLDEPMGGMTPEEKRDIVDIIRRTHTMGVTIFMIEHDMKALMSVVQRVIVIHFGEIIADGTPEEVQNAPLVIEAYLGEQLETDEVVGVPGSA